MHDNTMILNKSEKGGAVYISKALSKLTGSLLWGFQGDGAQNDGGVAPKLRDATL